MTDFRTWATVYKDPLNELYKLFNSYMRPVKGLHPRASNDGFTLFCETIYRQSSGNINKYDKEDFIRRQQQ